MTATVIAFPPRPNGVRKFTVAERNAIIGEASRRGMDARFLELDTGEEWASLGSHSAATWPIIVGWNDEGRKGAMVHDADREIDLLNGPTICAAVEAWRAAG